MQRNTFQAFLNDKTLARMQDVLNCVCHGQCAAATIFYKATTSDLPCKINITTCVKTPRKTKLHFRNARRNINRVTQV